VIVLIFSNGRSWIEFYADIWYGTLPGLYRMHCPVSFCRLECLAFNLTE
jgi:hypothetical protein